MAGCKKFWVQTGKKLISDLTAPVWKFTNEIVALLDPLEMASAHKRDLAVDLIRGRAKQLGVSLRGHVIHSGITTAVSGLRYVQDETQAWAENVEVGDPALEGPETV